MKERNDEYQVRREHLKDLSDKELKDLFYDLTNQVVDPFLELASTYTSKSIERSVLLRMGFSSLECKSIVDVLNEHNLLRKGAGHCVYRLAQDKKISLNEAGNQIVESDGIDYLQGVFTNNEKTGA